VTDVPEAYYTFVMDYAPYAYVVPPDTPDPEFGRAAFAAAFAVDFLYEAYFDSQFESRRTAIIDKISSLGSFILTQQCTDDAKLAYGGFKSCETSTYYYSVDACRAIPSLLKAYELTEDADFLNAAKLAGSTFLYVMQHKPSELGVHDKYYGGFARAVTDADVWMRQMDIENLYGFVGLKMLCSNDQPNNSKYEAMISDAVGFFRSNFEKLYQYYDPLPEGDADWHRQGSEENIVYDDCFAYALLGMYDYEGFNPTVQKIYSCLNTIRASSQYPAYNSAVCWAGYLNVVSRSPACDYYDAVAAGILSSIRQRHDKPSFKLSMEIISKHQGQFMFWGVKHLDYGAVENKQSMAAVCWLARLFLNYEEPVTRFTQILQSKGENVTVCPVREAGNQVSYGEGLETKAIVLPVRADEMVVEAGYVIGDYVAVYTFAPLRVHDRIRRKGEDYEVQSVQAFDFAGETSYFKSACRRLIGQ